MTEYNEHVPSNPGSLTSAPAMRGGNNGSVVSGILSPYMTKGVAADTKRLDDAVGQLSQENNDKMTMLSKAATGLTQKRFSTKANGPNEGAATVSGLQKYATQQLSDIKTPDMSIGT